MALQNYVVGEHEDVAMKLFVKTLEGEAALWFRRFPDKSIKTWDVLIKPFLKVWDENPDLASLINIFYQIKKRENETLMRFNLRFQRTLDKILDNAKLAKVVILTFYLNAFDS